GNGDGDVFDQSTIGGYTFERNQMWRALAFDKLILGEYTGQVIGGPLSPQYFVHQTKAGLNTPRTRYADDVQIKYVSDPQSYHRVTSRDYYTVGRDTPPTYGGVSPFLEAEALAGMDS